MSEIRSLLSQAQAAETRGDKALAAKLLREAAAYYRDRQMTKRAAQMLRQARRTEGLEDHDDAIFGFGSSFDDEAGDLDVGNAQKALEARGPALADASVEAWCSFCCRPQRESGALVSGTSGVFICQSCLDSSSRLLGNQTHGVVHRESRVPTTLLFELGAQRRARERWSRSHVPLHLVIGPEGSGKSTWLSTIHGPAVRVIEVDAAFDATAEIEVLTWLSKDRARSVFVSVRGAVPQPALLLHGDSAIECVYDSGSLRAAVPVFSPAFLSRIEAVHPFDVPTDAELLALGQALMTERGVSASSDVLQLVLATAQRAQTGAHELVSMLKRIPPGSYSL
jgi:hypothetical protein